LEISNGIISKEAWAMKCNGLGIEGIPLVIAAESAGDAKCPLDEALDLATLPQSSK